MPTKTRLELSLSLVAGDEYPCALSLESQSREDHWRILVALAAEILAADERRRAGSAVVLVTGSPAAERVLQDLKAAQ